MTTLKSERHLAASLFNGKNIDTNLRSLSRFAYERETLASTLRSCEEDSALLDSEIFLMKERKVLRTRIDGIVEQAIRSAPLFSAIGTILAGFAMLLTRR
jgi:hypothetical protein